MACLPECCTGDRAREEVVTPVRGDAYARSERARPGEPTVFTEARRQEATIAEPEVEREREPTPEPRQVEPLAQQLPVTAPLEEQPAAPSSKLAEPVIQDDMLIWEVFLEKTASGLGVDLSPHDGKSLLVGKVKDGAVSVWNSSRSPGAVDVVTRGDRIIAVNGAEESAEDILAKMRKDTMLVMRLRRRLFMAVRVRRKEGDELGLSWTLNDGTFVISDVKPDSAAATANRKHGAELEIRRHDSIIEINGEQDVMKFEAIMNSGKDLHLKVRHPTGTAKERLD